MINAKELRIGNLVYLELGLVSLNIHAITAKDIFDISEGRITLNALHGIPITEEGLLKMGFERYEEDDINGYLAYRPVYAHYSIEMFINDNGHVCTHYLGTAISTNHPQYVHQLQNLYFALTGEELTIKS